MKRGIPKVKKCKWCHQKLGVFTFSGVFCSHLCKLRFQDEKKRIQNY